MTAVRCTAGDAAIRKLNLTGNNIGDKGATLLAEMLKVVLIPCQCWLLTIPLQAVRFLDCHSDSSDALLQLTNAG